MEVIKFLWRFIHSFLLRKKNVRISPFSHFSSRTVFEGNNVVNKYSSVSGSEIGRNTYFGENANVPNSKIGRFCSLGNNISVIAATHPSTCFVSTSPSFYSTSMQCRHTFVNTDIFDEHLQIDGYNIIIGNDVWIGNNVLLKGGITIGDGAIVAMGSVVTKDVPPYAIVGGVPAKLIRFRFGPEQVSKLLDFQWWNKNEEWLKKNVNAFVDVNIFLEHIK